LPKYRDFLGVCWEVNITLAPYSSTKRQSKGENQMSKKQYFFESDEAYRERISKEANESIVEKATGSVPRQGFFEGNEAYRNRISQEANEQTIAKHTGSAPTQCLTESDDDYRHRSEIEANEHVIENSTGSAPSQHLCESDQSYADRVSIESNERTIEDSTGKAPTQSWFESNDDYRDRLKEKADEIISENNEGGCFITTACVTYAGLPDDCEELQILRRYRDGYILNLPNGRAMVSEYYRNAQHIVIQITNDTEREFVLNSTMTTIKDAVNQIKKWNNQAALNMYVCMFQSLVERYRNC
jgi:hypothetical protein